MIVEAVELRESAAAAQLERIFRPRRALERGQRGKAETGRALGEELDLARWCVELQIGIGNVRDVQRPDAAFGPERRDRRVASGRMIEDRIQRS